MYRFIRGFLQFICIADIFLGLLIVFTPLLLFRVFGVPAPDEALWFQLIGLMLIPMGIDSWVGFRSSYQYRSNVVVSCASRFAVAAFLLIVYSVRAVPTILLVLAIGEAMVGCLTLYYLSRLAWGRRAARLLVDD
jgi:hypothetical protein